MTCVTYDSCEDGACDEHAHAANDGNVCKCIDGWHRVDINAECMLVDCVIGCELCNPGAGFSACLECSPGYIDIAPSGSSYKYCVAECPSNFTENCEFDGNNAKLANWYFNVPSTEYQNGAVNSEITLNTITEAPSGSPAKNRGIYFDG